jgi:hypothetical protein
MQLGRDAVPALSQTKAANNQDKRNNDFLAYNFKPEIPDLTWQRTGQLRRIIEEQALEIAKLKNSELYAKDNANKYYNESHYYKDKCIELYEKLQENGVKVEMNFLRVAG